MIGQHVGWTYSQFDWDLGKFHYFRSRTPASVGGWRPLTGLGIPKAQAPQNGIGISIEDAFPLLPPDAVYVGTGSCAMGQIVRPRQPKFLQPAPRLAPQQLGSLPEMPKTVGIGYVGMAFGAGVLVGSFMGPLKWLFILGGLAAASRRPS